MPRRRVQSAREAAGTGLRPFPGHGRPRDAELLRLIREIAARHHRRYGSPRVRAELRLMYGKRVSLKKAARLMREHNLNARLRRSFTRTTNSCHGLPVCENLLNCEFSAILGLSIPTAPPYSAVS
jgi:transposase InsO family protein